MNVRLNPAGQVPARLLAQMRLVATNANLVGPVAVAFADGAAERGLTVVMAEKLATGAAFLAERGKAQGLDDEVMLTLTGDYLEQGAKDGMANPVELAASLIVGHLAEMDAAHPVRRHSTGMTFGGHAWDSPRGVAMKAGDALAAQIGQRMGLKVEPQMGREMANMSLGEMAMVCARAAGLRPFNVDEAIRMAGGHTGSDFPYAVQSGLSGVVAQGFDLAKPAIDAVASEIPATDYRLRNSVRLSASGMPDLVVEGGEITSTTINEKGELAPKLDDYARMFSISNQALINDATAMNLLAQIGEKMVQGSVGRYRGVLLAPLLANAGLGQTMVDTLALFHTTHNNLAAVAAAISVTSLGVARTAMRRQVDSMGAILAIEPTILLVPPEQETLAQQIVATITAAKTSDVNPFANGLQVVVEPGLTNATAWYLVADPARAKGLSYAYLDGQRAPTIETQSGWNTLGMDFRLTWALGEAFVETASWFRNAGA